MTSELDPNVIAAKVIVSATERTLETITSPARDAFRRTLHLLSNAYQPYLEMTFRKVRSIKTFLKPNEPISLMDNYVEVELETDNDIYTVSDIIDQFINRQRIVITGTAGRGKRVLTRYISLCLYHNPRGTIPIFLELRSMNSITNKNLLQYIHSQYKVESNIKFADFTNALKKGYFALIFDGFDEIQPSARIEIEDQLLKISLDNPECPIMVSGRWDDRFQSWDEFKIVRISPMSLEQTRLLIERADYDHDVKKKFLKRLNTDFFRQHESFLNTPLLAIMLMLTFEEFAEIPTNLHIFYKNAFDTLARRHDAMKSQFLREMHSGCSADEFRKVFSSFCVLTYTKSKFEFSDDDALMFIERASRQQSVDANPQDILTDLIESLCLLQKEGFQTSFVHRSFQEYFCAVFVANSASGIVEKFLSEGKFRIWDNVLPMLYGMAPERVESEWAYAAVTELVGEYPTAGEANVLKFLREMFRDIEIVVFPGRRLIPQWYETRSYRRVSILRRLYDKSFMLASDGERSGLGAWGTKNWQAKLIDDLRVRANGGNKLLQDLIADFDRPADRRKQRHGYIGTPFNIGHDDIDLLRLVGYYDFAVQTIKGFKRLKEDIDARMDQDNKFLKLVFDDASP